LCQAGTPRLIDAATDEVELARAVESVEMAMSTPGAAALRELLADKSRRSGWN